MMEKSGQRNTLVVSVASLEKLTYDDLRDWMEVTLSTLDAGHIDLSYYEDIDDAIIDLVHASHSLHFQQRVRNAVVELLESWSTEYDAHTFDYLYRLIVIVGGLKITRSRKILVDYAIIDRFKGKIGLGQDLHQTILRVIWGLGIRDPRTKSAFTREIEKQTDYTILCFNALYDTDLIGSMEYLPDRLQYVMLNKSNETKEDWYERFGRFIRKMDSVETYSFKRHLLEVFEKLDLEGTKFLIDTLSYNQVQFAVLGSFRGGEGQSRCIVIKWPGGPLESIKNPTQALLEAVQGNEASSIEHRLLVLKDTYSITHDNNEP